MGTNSFILLAILILGIAAFIQKEWKLRKKRKQLARKFPATTIRQLRIGDAFIFELSENADVYRLLEKKELSESVRIQKYFRSDVAPIDKEEYSFAGTRVYFVRHTIPVPGEDIYVEDLAPGDKFQLYIPNTKKVEQNPEVMVERFPAEQYQEKYTAKGGTMVFCEIMEKGFEFDKFRRIDTGDVGRIGRLTKVIFISHRAKEAKENSK